MTEPQRKYTLRKPERLGEKKIMDELFMHGECIQVPGIKLLWKKESTNHLPLITYHYRVAFTVPKRLFKKAVTRNLLKRRMREAYRKNKSSLITHHSSLICYLIFIYTGREINSYSEIESKIVLTLQRLEIGIRGKE